MNGMYQHSVFLQVREFIRAEIEAGEYAPGMPLPAVEELADLYGVKEKMVENAIDALANEGLLRKISEKEVYVLGDKIERNIEVLEGFTQTMLDKNLKPSFKIVSKVRRGAGNLYGAMFGIPAQDEIFYIKRLCYANEDPVSLEEILIPCYLIPKLEGINLSIFSIYELYGMYGIRLSEARQTLDLIVLQPADARLLGLKDNLPAMLFQSITSDEQGRVIEFNRNYVRSDKCDFSVHFFK